MARNRGSKWHFILFALLLITLGTFRWRAVEGLLPYSQHLDEVFLTQRAQNMLQKGDANPHFFRYPSLPIYLTVGAMKLGAYLDSSKQQVAGWVIPKKGAAYEPPAIFAAPRFLFALASLAALGFVGLIASKIFRSNLALFLAPLILLSSEIVRHSSVVYLNVDVITLLFVTAALFVAFQWWDRDTYLMQSVVPGVLSGMAIASKYNSGLILLPLALRIIFVSRRRCVPRLVALVGCAAATFWACVPYSLLDPTKFRSDVKWEIHHYSSGHKGHDGPAGVPQLLFYLRSLAQDYGGLVTALAGVGIVYWLIVERKRTAVLLSLPLFMLLHMSCNRVHFLRTVLPVFALLPVFATGGILALGHLITTFWQRKGAKVTPRVTSTMSAVGQARLWSGAVVCGVCALYFSRPDLPRLLDSRVVPDPRNVVTSWLQGNANDALVIVPVELGLAPTRIAGLHTRSIRPGLYKLDDELARAPQSGCYVVQPSYRLRSKSERRRSKEIDATLKAWGAKPLLTLDGDRTPMPSPSTRRPRPISRPALTIQYIARCGSSRKISTFQPN